MRSTETPRLATLATSAVKKHKCRTCEENLPVKDFPDSQLRHKGDPSQNSFLRCTKCHTCTKCNEQKDIHAFDGPSSACRKCERHLARWTCDARQQELEKEAFDQNIFVNARDHGRKRVCAVCCNNGMSPKDVQKYCCSECGDRGHLKFPYEARRRYKESNGRTKIECSDCTAKHTQLEKLLRQPMAWKCRCPRTGSGRSHNPENIKCDLFESQMGQKRWPGKNIKVSEADWHFVERMRKRQKR